MLVLISLDMDHSYHILQIFDNINPISFPFSSEVKNKTILPNSAQINSSENDSGNGFEGSRGWVVGHHAS